MDVNASRAALALAVTFFVAGAPRLALSGEAPSPVSAGAIAAARTAIEEQRYDDAIRAVRAGFESDDLKARAESLEIAAIALLLDARPAEGALYVHALYEIAPAFRLSDPSLPPRVTAPFDAEAAKPHERAVGLAIEAEEERADYVLVTSSAAAHVDLLCRPSTGGAYTAVTLSKASPTRARFHLPTASPYGCFALAADPQDLPLGRLGTREHPVVVKPAPPQPSSGVLSRWWFWTAVGAVVVGGTAFAIVETRPRDVATPHADLTVRAQGWSFR